MMFFSRYWQRAFHFTSFPFQLDRWLFSLPKGWKVSFGLWVKYTVDNADHHLPTVPVNENHCYEPLDLCPPAIRLLLIHPGNPEDVITSNLITVDLLNAPDYEALSYVWGNHNVRQSIYIDGRALSVHESLYEALRALRSSTSGKLIWADAICIDQCNDYEKCHQVGIMGQIYQTAKTVAVFLGRSNEKISAGMQALRYFTEMHVAPEDVPWTYTALPELEQNLREIFHCPWFHRIWTVQEAALARHTTLICGEDQVSWRTDLRTMRSMVFRIKIMAIHPYFFSTSEHASGLDWSPLLNICEAQLRQAARRECISLQRTYLDLAYDFRHRNCSDPRDKYFAIFSIVENDYGGELKINADYTVSLEEVHRRFTAEMQRMSNVGDYGMVANMNGALFG